MGPRRGRRRARAEEVDPDLDRRPHAANAVQPDPVRRDRRLARRGRSSRLAEGEGKPRSPLRPAGRSEPAAHSAAAPARPMAPPPPQPGRAGLLVPALLGLLLLAVLIVAYLL